MPIETTLTILNHGTMNASGDKLVLSRLKSLMVGAKGKQWIMNTGVGTLAQARDRTYLPGWNAIGGTFWAKGINKNVADSVAFVKAHCGTDASRVRVNMAGHSRGSMTALKIAHALQNDPATQGCEVNLFLIDPVPGNLGWVNSGMYKQIAIQANVKSAFMILAESERRNCFKPYVDRVFLQDMPTHRMDTIPGNHGGINELSAEEHEAADIVLHHAVLFLGRNGTPMNLLNSVVKGEAELLELYATIMLKFQRYKAQGHASKNVAFLPMGGTSTGDRNIQVRNDAKRVGPFNVPGLAKNKYDSTPLSQVGGSGPSTTALNRESRFFANADHKARFRASFPNAARWIVALEWAGTGDAVRAMHADNGFASDRERMSAATRTHLTRWLHYVAGAA